MSQALRALKENNEYPMVFIGSGISRRYLTGFPSWEELLERCWEISERSGDFYSYLNTLRRTIRDQNPSANDEEVKYLTNIVAGTEIEKSYNDSFYEGKITIENYSQKDAYRFDVSPFKKMLSNTFKEYTIKEGMSDELLAFKKFINKTQIILTTNYDTFIRDCFNSVNPETKIKTYIGQSGFFEQTFGWAEEFKLHGCVEKPESIVISQPDYKRFDNNSILISAKIISLLIHSPIIFLGYSLTDMNVRKIIRDFSSSLTPSELKIMGSRIIIVEWEKDKHDFEEYQRYDSDLGCEYTVIKTDNYEMLFKLLSEINQGVSPAEVRRYQHVLKRLIVDSGKKGSLNTLLITPEHLDGIERRIGDENLVVALGDAAYIFKIPDYVSYIHDYFCSDKPFSTEIGLRFVTNQNGRVPMMKVVKDVEISRSNLYPSEKEKLKQKLANLKTAQQEVDSIPGTNKIRYGSLAQIREQAYSIGKEYEVIGYNALTSISQDELLGYIKEKILEIKASGTGIVNSAFKRLLCIYDRAYNI